MDLSECPERPLTVQGDTDLVSVDLQGVLDDGELATGTPTITELTTSDLAFANQSVNSAALVINGKTVPIGMAVQFKMTGQLAANTPYQLKITFGTDSTPARTKSIRVVYHVVTIA